MPICSNWAACSAMTFFNSAMPTISPVSFVGDETVHFVKADDHLAVLLLEHGLIDARDALARFAVRGDDQHTRVIPDPQADHVQPIFHLTRLDAAARLPDQQVERTAAEEELVRDAVDILPAKIPGVELNLDPVLGGMRQAQTVNVNFDAVCGGFVFLRRFILVPSTP